MKPLFKLLFILLGLSCSNLHAQTFSTLSESDRNAKLIDVATYVYKNVKFADFYREYGTPEIRSFVVEGENLEDNSKSKYYGLDLGPLIYVVTFRYDKTKESMDWGYAAEVFISDKCGATFAINLGNGMGYETYVIAHSESNIHLLLADVLERTH